MLVALIVAFIGQTYSQSEQLIYSLKSKELQQVENLNDLPEWVKFLAPIIAGIIGKLIDLWSKKLDQKKQIKNNNLKGSKLWQKEN